MQMRKNCNRIIKEYVDYKESFTKFTWYNRPFYSCMLSVLAWIESEAGVDLVLIETSLLFLCK